MDVAVGASGAGMLVVPCLLGYRHKSNQDCPIAKARAKNVPIGRLNIERKRIQKHCGTEDTHGCADYSVGGLFELEAFLHTQSRNFLDKRKHEYLSRCLQETGWLVSKVGDNRCDHSKKLWYSTRKRQYVKGTLDLGDYSTENTFRFAENVPSLFYSCIGYLGRKASRK
jgi:hypothetical protein